MASQWRTQAVSSLAGARLLWLGLDYAALEPTCRLMGEELAPDEFDDLRAMETEAAQVLNSTE